MKLVREHTARSDSIAVLFDKDPETASIAKRLPELLDRHLMVIQNWDDWKNMRPRSILLSTVDLREELKFVAKSSSDSMTRRPFLREALHWYSKNIAKRRPGDKIDFADTYYLYEQNP